MDRPLDAALGAALLAWLILLAVLAWLILLACWLRPRSSLPSSPAESPSPV